MLLAKDAIPHEMVVLSVVLPLQLSYLPAEMRLEQVAGGGIEADLMRNKFDTPSVVKGVQSLPFSLQFHDVAPYYLLEQEPEPEDQAQCLEDQRKNLSWRGDDYLLVALGCRRQGDLQAELPPPVGS